MSFHVFHVDPGRHHVDPSIAQDEELDSLHPLRHLMQDESLGSIDEMGLEFFSLIPEQQRSVQNETLRLSFSNRRSSIQSPIFVSLLVDASPGCGGIAWPAGQILANYLVSQGLQSLRGRNVLELGSGTGLVGLVAGKLGGKVWITDQAPLLNIMQRNVSINELSPAVTVSEFNWGSPLPTGIPRPNLILAADCVYFEPAFPLLVQTLVDLVDTTTEVLFCYKSRRKADKRFFAMLRKKFTWTEVTDDPDRKIYSRESISLIRLFKL